MSCRNCALKPLCLPGHLPVQEACALESVVERGRQLAPGMALVRAGATMDALLVVRSGSAKRFSLTLEGTEQVHGFVLPGETVGLEGFATGRYGCEVNALEPLSYCRVPMHKLEQLLERLPGLRREMLRLLGQALEDALRLRGELAETDARGRVARFLADLSDRLARRGFPPHDFHLSMSRADIARHLGLTLETVSRAFGTFKRQGWLRVRARDISVLQPEALAALAGAAPCA
ncbi:MAG: helix-turn-helix domain-containing protein [Steroidobacteraceae bacterium]